MGVPLQRRAARAWGAARVRATPLSRVEAGPALVFTARVEEFIRHDLGGTPLVYHSRSFHALGKHSNVDYAI